MCIIGFSFTAALFVLGWSELYSPIFVFCTCAAALAVFLLVPSLRRYSEVIVCLISILAAAVAFYGKQNFEMLPALEHDGKTEVVSAVITDDAKLINGRYVYSVKAKSIGGEKCSLKLRLTSNIPIEADTYDTVTFDAKIFAPGDVGSSTRNSYRSKGIYLSCYPVSEVKVSSPEKRPVGYLLVLLRRHISESVLRYLPGDEGGLLLGVLISDRTSVSAASLDAMRKCGITHIVSVSGLHMSLISMAAFTFFLLAFGRYNTAIYFTAAITVFFVALTGFSTSAVRSGLMTLVFLYGNKKLLEYDPLSSLAFAALLILIFNPFAATDLSFLMSFVATLGIILVVPDFDKKIRAVAEKIKRKRLAKLFRAVADAAVVSLAANIFLLPVSILFFGSISPVTLFANVCIFWCIAPMILCAALLASFGVIPFVSQFLHPLALAGGLLARFTLEVSRLFSKLTLAQIGADYRFLKVWLGLSFVLVAAALLLNISLKRLFRLTVGLTALTLLVSVSSYVFFNPNSISVSVADVGNGSAVVVSKSGEALLIACGGDDAGFAVSNFLDSRSISSLKLAIFPRISDTEISGAEELFADYKPKTLVLPEKNRIKNLVESDTEIVFSKGGSSQVFDGCALEYSSEKGKEYAYFIANGVSFLCVYSPSADLSELPDEYLSADILICRAAPPEGLNTTAFDAAILSDSDSNAADKFACPCYSTAESGNITVRTADGAIYKIEGE